MKKIMNNELIDLTTDEVTARQAEETQAVIDKQAEETAEANAITKKASAVAKLKALGLTDEEIGALKI